MHSAKRSSTRALLVAAFALAAAGSAVALLYGSPGTALVGVACAGLAGVLVVLHVMLGERRRHAQAEQELASQAHFLESLVDSFGALTATLDVEEILELARHEAGRLFAARASLLPHGERRRHGPAESELVIPLRARGQEMASVRLVRADPFDRDALVRARVFGDFASRAIENAQLLAEAQVRESERARLSEQVITAEQEERRRLALFLHDTSIQSLSGIALMLDGALHALSEARTDEARSVMEGALERHRHTIRALRDLSFNLEPVVLRDQGFAPALDALAEQVGLAHRIRVDADVEAAEALPTAAQAGLYQIIREALNASIRRGPPKAVDVRIGDAEDGRLELTIADDGPVERRRSSFDGLAERARTLSGELVLEPGADGGTTVRVLLPAPAGPDPEPEPAPGPAQ